MRTKESNWINTHTLKPKYGIKVLVNGKWMHLMNDGKPCIFERKEERDELRKVVAKMEKIPHLKEDSNVANKR